MSTTTPDRTSRHPYGAALEAGDLEAFSATLHPDVVLYTPGFEVPIRGRDDVVASFTALAGNVESLEFVDELWAESSHVLIFRLVVDGDQIDGADHLRFDADGLVTRIVISARPLAALQALAARMADTHARLTAA